MGRLRNTSSFLFSVMSSFQTMISLRFCSSRTCCQISLILYPSIHVGFSPTSFFFCLENFDFQFHSQLAKHLIANNGSIGLTAYHDILQWMQRFIFINTGLDKTTTKNWKQRNLPSKFLRFFFAQLKINFGVKINWIFLCFKRWTKNTAVVQRARWK